jgi:hypothetical protein
MEEHVASIFMVKVSPTLKMEAVCWCPSTKLHGVITQETKMWVFITVENLKSFAVLCPFLFAVDIYQWPLQQYLQIFLSYTIELTLLCSFLQFSFME